MITILCARGDNPTLDKMVSTPGRSNLPRLFYLSVFFTFLLLAGMALGACVGEFIGLVLLAHSSLAVYALPVGMLAGSVITLGISLSFIIEMNSFSAAIRASGLVSRAYSGAAPVRLPRPAGAKAGSPSNR